MSVSETTTQPTPLRVLKNSSCPRSLWGQEFWESQSRSCTAARTTWPHRLGRLHVPSASSRLPDEALVPCPHPRTPQQHHVNLLPPRVRGEKCRGSLFRALCKVRLRKRHLSPSHVMVNVNAHADPIGSNPHPALTKGASQRGWERGLEADLALRVPQGDLGPARWARGGNAKLSRPGGRGSPGLGKEDGGKRPNSLLCIHNTCDTKCVGFPYHQVSNSLWTPTGCPLI